MNRRNNLAVDAATLRLEKDNSGDIGFVLECRFAGVISFQELKDWLYHVIEHRDGVPTYFWDILDLDNEFDFKAGRILGFQPTSNVSEREAKAICGIAYRRFADHESDFVGRATALQCLRENPHIENRFVEMFPFVDLPEE